MDKPPSVIPLFVVSFLYSAALWLAWWSGPVWFWVTVVPVFAIGFFFMETGATYIWFWWIYRISFYPVQEPETENEA